MVVDLKKVLKENKKLKKKLKKKGYDKIIKHLKGKVSEKKVFKPSQKTVKIPEYKAPSVLGDENRFFKGQMEEERKSLFFG